MALQTKQGLYPGKHYGNCYRRACKSIMAFHAAVLSQYCPVPCDCLPSCYDPFRHERKSEQLYCCNLHPSNVDEFLLRTLAWQTLLEKTGVINNILSFLHLPALNIINTPPAIILGMVYNFLPFMVLPIYNALVKIDKNVINAAKDLGANQVQTFIRIVLPLSYRA